MGSIYYHILIRDPREGNLTTSYIKPHVNYLLFQMIFSPMGRNYKQNLITYPYAVPIITHYLQPHVQYLLLQINYCQCAITFITN